MGITFSIDKETLESAVAKIIGVCEFTVGKDKNCLPYFFHIRVDGYGEVLKLSAGNSVRNIEVMVPDIVSNERFCFGVSGRYFHNLLKALPKCDLKFTLTNVCFIHNGSSTLKLQVLPADHFPCPSSRDDHPWWEADFKKLFDALTRVMYCSDTVGLIPKNYPKSVNIGPESFICTDHRRFSIFPNRIIPLEGKILLPVESIKAMSSLFNSEDSLGYVYTEGNAMYFSQKYVYASTRLVEYDSPDFRSLLPRDNGLVCLVHRKPFLSAAKRALIVARKDIEKDKVEPLTLTFSDNKMVMSLDNKGFGIAEELEVEYQGPHMSVDINLYFLYQAAKHIEGDKVRIELRGPKIPLVITDIKEEHKNVILPIIR